MNQTEPEPKCHDSFLVLSLNVIEGLRERTEHLDIFLFSAHHSIMFSFRCSVYWECQILVF